ncbi:MerR family transcriptional regulator [Microbacterium sp. SORGH_AS_0888]|uniref:MerR family transcriptional regulator n=1 Tax=Microbacterium sp. SORGH_AS_0888 TaxID=3041791 RepID=UPI00278AE5E0|nr:MerR family transcriptional regulator [Microbacterium sp. SORGH_AS_0888]MDQ1131218.1 peroxiredoxin/DNA-binding transcriptional MerR regulator [Microbacterium sp. SORGH_AS_0888]
MRIGELAERSGVTTKAVRYYERLGLIGPNRLPNGYRDYDESHVRVVIEIRELAATGITARQAAPFVECLRLGHDHGDDCVSSLAAYRDGIAEIDRIIATLRARRAQLAERLHESASRTFTKEQPMSDDGTLPKDLPIPADDGAAAHLPGLALPALTLPTADGDQVDLGELTPGRTVIYLYPLTGRPDADLPDGWDSIPGARGCTTEACDFRDHHDDLRNAGVNAVYGLSSQDVDYQAEVVGRLRLPFTMLSDERFRLADALDLPTFRAPGRDRLYSRLTLIVRDGRIEHVFYPIFPPNTHAQQVLTWLIQNPA